MNFLAAIARSVPRAAVGGANVPAPAEASHRRAARAVGALAAAAALLAVLALAPSPVPAQSPPATPASVDVTRADGSLTASWGAVDGATSYWITYSSDGGASWSLAARNHAGTGITVSPVTNSATYIVGVRARNEHGDSGWRNSPAAGPFVPPSPPATPGSVAVERADGTLTASWGAVDGATSYWITYSSDGGASWSLAARNHSRTSITVSPVTNSATYIVGVRARSEHGDSGWRNSPAAGPFVPDISAALSIADAKANEGDALSFTVTLDNAVQGGFTVTPSFTDGTATGGADFTANTNALSFSGTAGETKTFAVPTTEDTDVEDDETFTVGLSVSGTTHSVTAGDTATGTIANDDSAAASITLSVNPSSLSEDAGATSVAVTATASHAVAANTPVTVSIGGGTATSGTDYRSVASLTLEITAGGTTGTGAFKLTPIDDTEIEGKETISISGSASGLSVTGTTLTLTDKEEVTAEWWYGARLSVSPGSVSENGGAQKVTVTAEVSEWGTSTSDLSYEVTVGKGGDGAVSGTDYHAVSRFNIVIKANRRSGSNSFSLEPIGDTDWEGDETITIHASGTDGAQSTTLTLTDEGDRPYGGPQVTLSANPSTVSEADGATTVTVTAASAAHSASRTVTVSVGGSGTAASGTDYAAVSDFTIALAKNATSATGTFTLTPTQDKLAEGDETIALAGDVEGVTAKLTGTTLTLTDDEAAPDVTLSASPSSVTENGGAKTVTVTATAAAAAAKARTVLVAVGNRQDTATAGTDYAVVPAFNITIAANATTATGTFALTPTNDTSVEDAESISIDGTPESAGAAFTVGGTAIALTDDDAMPAVTLAATPSSVAEAALATSVTVKATAASAVAWARTVTVSVGKTGSAASGTDYAAVSDFDIAIAANALSGTGTFTLKPTQDTTNEGNETIGVAGTSLNTTVTGTTVTLADDDINPAVTLSVSPASVLESASATTVTVTATAASAITSARTVSVKVGGGTATSGTDYAAVSDFNITIAANATSGTGTFTLTPTQDTTVEGGETIGVSGSSTGTTVTGTTVALTDDDGLPALTLSVSTSSVSEGASATSVTVTATAASSISSARTVTVSVGQTGTAAPGSDYAAVTDFTITIAANATSGTGAFTLTPTQDTLFEQSETIGVDGSSPDTTVTNATITLTDDDKDTVTLSLNRATLDENASGTSVTVTATAATAISSARTVTVSVGDTGTATSGTDYATVSDFTITIAANATSGTGTFTLTPTNDSSNEGNETIGVAGTNSLSTVTGTTLTLVDDELPTITLSTTTAQIFEHLSYSHLSITATRSSSTASAVAVTVSLGASGDSAIKGVDYRGDDFTITIPANQTSASSNFTISGIPDTQFSEDSETVSFVGTATGYRVTGTSIGLLNVPGTIGLSVSVSSVNELDSATTVTLTATRGSTSNTVNVHVSVGGGSATEGTDYKTVPNKWVTIPHGSTTGTNTFTLTPIRDALLESDETINVTSTSCFHWYAYACPPATITLTDAQPISLSAHPSSVSEGAPGTQVAVTATATGTVATPRTVSVSVGDTGTATSGTDYAAVSDFDITIPANKTGATNTFTLTPTKDSAAEGDETIGVSGSSTGAYVYPTTLTLADTDPAVTLTAAPSSIAEGAGATSVTVTATAASAIGTARTVTVSVGNSGTATSGTDYAAVSDFTITIAANATSGTGSFTLTPTDDTALEGDETIHVTGTSAEAATISRTTLTLTDDDLPTIALATVPAYVAVAEGAGLSSVTVRATAAAAMKAETTVTLTVGASGDSATKTTDYTTSNVRTITIPKGQSTAEASFELTPVQDTAVEGDETVSVSGSSSGGHTVTGTSLTLTDDDNHQIALSASPSSVGEGASATSVTVTATAKYATSSARTVTVKVGGSGTATSGTDYAAVTDFTITIAANAKTGTGTFTLTPTQDTTVEGSETIGLAGTSTNSTVAGTTVTLTDDDSYPAITLSANPSSVSEGASATSVTVTATAASAISSARTVTVSVGGGGTASRGTDYATVADFTVTIAANATSGTGTFTLTPAQDTEVEGSETIGVAGTSPSSTVTGTTVTLADDDTHAIDLSASPSSVSESKASETITVSATINAARSSATTVTVSVGESGDEATSGTDYEAVSDFTVTIAANKTSGTGTFTFKPKTDTAYEGFESVTISGTTSSGGGGVNALGANAANASIPVTDTSLSIHDSSNYPAVTLSAAPSSVGEGAGATSVTVTATAASAIASSREVTVSVGGSGTATSGTDYTAVSDFIVKIAANATSGTGTFTLTPADDSTVEGSETIGVAGTSLSTTVTGTTVTLTDNDTAAVTVNDVSEPEGDDMTFTVTLDTQVAGGLTVTPSFTDVTATEGTDYDENTAALTFTGNANETKSFTVSTTQDTVVEGNETFTVGLSVSGTTLTGSITSTDTGTGTIESGTESTVDTATLTIDDASASEGDSMTFTVTLSEAVAGGLTVTPSFTDVTAVEGTDYDENTTALTFTGTKGETQTFTVSTDEDAVLEANETFTVSLTVSGTTLGDRITSTDTGTGTVNNDDSAAVTVNDASASEGEDMTFTVTLSEAVQGGLTVTPDFTDVTAVEGTDYDENTTALTFTGTKGETQTFTVSTDEDAVLEANETFTVGLTVSDAPTGTTVTATDTGTGTINNDDGATVTVNDADADEGNSMTFTVTLGAAVQGGLEVTPSYTNGTAADGDYTANTTALSFTGTAGETKTFTVSTTEDAVLEADETFTVGLTVSGTSLSVTATDTGTGTIDNDDSATVTVNDANADEGDGISFTVTLGAAVQGGLKVTPGYTNGTAANGDYSKNTTALTFTGTANETKTFTVSTTDDTVLEADETFTVGLTVSGTSLSVTATDAGTGTINNDDSAAVTVNDANASEGEKITFTVTLSEAVQDGLKVTPSFTDVSAVEGTDYDENTTALSFTGTKGETKTFTVDTTEDAVFEANETFTVSLAVSDAPAGTTVTATDTGTGTVNNDDSAAVTVNDASADEGDAMTFTVTLSEAVQGGLKVTPGYTNGTAASGDYTANTKAISFSGTKGETKTFTVSTTEDAVLEAHETFKVGLTVSDAPSGVADSDTGMGTINNDDSAAVTINDADADEGNRMTFTVTLSEAVQDGLKVTPGYTNGTAASLDYTANTKALTFTGTKGETKTFTVSTTEDDVVEGNETFTVGLTVSNAPKGTTVTATDTGTGTINNDDGAVVTVNNANADEGDDMTFTVTLGEAVQGGLTVTPGFTDVTAVEGTDYDENTTALSFTGTKGETKTFTASTTEDAVLEADETFTVGLSVSNSSVTATDTGTGTINDDDSAAVTVNDASASEGNSMTFTVTLDKAVQGGLTVTPSYANGSAGSSDYTENTTALTFTGAANETQTFTVSTTEDAILEGAETFTVALSVSKSSVTSTDTGTGTINDDDSAAVTVNDASADEGDGMTFTVTLGRAVQGGLTVTPSYTNGTAGSGDYTENTTALTFIGTANETRTFTVSTTEDAILEGAETFTVALSVSNSGVTSTDTGTGTINDDDGAAVTVNDASADEGDGMTFTVTLGQAVQGGLTVTPGFTDGTAVEGTDYTENTAALSFSGAKGETKTFTVSTTEDDVFEGSETFTVGLSVSGTSLGVTAGDTGTGTINDDDGAVVTVNNASAAEGETMTFTVTLGQAVQGGLTVTPSFTDGTAVEGTDYTENTRALTFTGTANETRTFTVSTTEDTVSEGNETFTVGLTVSGTSLDVADDDTGTGTIVDDDNAPSVNLSAAPASVSEGAGDTTVTVTAAFSNSSTYETDTTVTVSVGNAGDSATSGADYAAVTDFDIVIAAGKTSGKSTFTLAPMDDTLIEGNEAISVDGAASELAVNGTSMTLTDDDGAPAINLSVNPSSVPESAGATTMTVTAAFSNANTYSEARTVTVSVGGTTDTATSGTDYSAVPSFEITIAAGKTSGTDTFTLAPTQDTLIEGNEAISVDGAAPELAVNGTSITLTDDDDAPAINLSVSPSSVAEDAGATTVTVTAAFSNASTYAEARAVAVSVGASGDSATSGSDYGAVKDFEITVAAGKTAGTGTFTLTPTDDTLIESDETITIEGFSDGIAVNGTSMTLTDNDGAPAIDLSVSPSSVAEDAGATPVTVTATFSNATTYADDTTVTVSVGDSADGATSGTDYGAVSDFTITIAAGVGSGSASFTLTSVDDTLVEGNETITVSGANAALTVNGTNLTLADDEAVPLPKPLPSISLSANPFAVSEDAGGTTVTVTATVSDGRSFAEDRAVTVSVGAGGDSAVSGTDYAAATDFDLIIAAGASGGSATFTLTPTQDTLVEGDEAITISGSSTDLTVNGTSMTLTDDDRTPAVGVEEDEPMEDEALPRVSVADARADEGADLIFKVTLDRAADETVSIAYATADGTATAGKDYTAVSGTLSFAPGDTEGTVTVETLDNAMDEGDETVLLRLSRPVGIVLADPSAVGTIANDDPLPAALTIHCGRSSAEHAVDAVKARLNGDRQGSHLTIGGEQVPISGTGLEARPPWHSTTPDGEQNQESRSLTGNEVLAESSFRLSPPAETEHSRGDERWTAWGSGASTGFEGRADQLYLEGEVVGATVGLDAESDRWTVGVAAAHNRCEGTWRDAKSGQSGKMESPLTSVHPYLRWADGALSLWGVLGLGQGDMTVTVDGKQEDSYTTGVDMGMVALGGRRGLASAEESGGLEIAALWDTLLVWTTSDAAEDMSASRSHTSRTRLGLEAGRTLDLGGGAVLSPSLELGLRHDGGDAETGFGVEIGGEVLYTDASLGLTLGLHGRGMLVHEDADYREWGARGTVQVDPGADGLGLSVRLEPSWGAPESSVIGMWDGSVAFDRTTFDGGTPAHLDAEIGWGLEAWSGRAVLTPAVGFGRSSEGEQILRLGARLSAVNGVELSLSGEHRTLVDGEAELGLVLRGRAAW